MQLNFSDFQKMGRGSPMCKKLHIKTVEQFQNNVLECKIAKILSIS